MSGFGFTKVFSEKWRKVLDGVLGGYCRGTVMVRSTCRVLPKYWRWSCVIDRFYKGRWSCLIDHRLSLENQMSSPFPRAFTKKVFIKVFFNKDIEMSYDMLYRQEKL
jgi:hypothetical protein